MFMKEDIEQPDWTSPNFCPYCGSKNLADSEEWEQRDCPLPKELQSDDVEETQLGFRLHGQNECLDCGGEFETVDEIRSYKPRNETHTIQIAWDEGMDSIIGVKYIEGGEDDFAVEAERAKWNMLFGGCGEIQGPEYTMRKLYSFLNEKTEIDAEEESFTAGKWLLDSEEK